MFPGPVLPESDLSAGLRLVLLGDHHLRMRRAPCAVPSPGLVLRRPPLQAKSVTASTNAETSIPRGAEDSPASGLEPTTEAPAPPGGIDS